MTKIFAGILILNENNEAEKAIGIIRDMSTNSIERINTEGLSDKAAKVLLSEAGRSLVPMYEKLEPVKVKKNDHILFAREVKKND